MYKTPSYEIHASFLVPAYNLPEGVLSHHVTTVNEQLSMGTITTDIWLINAKKEDPKKSMIASLRKEKINFQAAAVKELTEEKPANNKETSSRIHQLEKDKDLFTELIILAQDPVKHKQPDVEFLKIANIKFASSGFSSCQPDLNNYLYLAGLSRYKER